MVSDTPHYENKTPFEVPDGWEWVRLEDYLLLLSGQDYPPQKYNSDHRGIPYIIGASNIENEQLSINRWTDEPSVISTLNDVLVVCKGAGVGKIAMNNVGDVHIARQIQAIRDETGIINSKYIKLCIASNISEIIANANGLIPGLKRELLLSLIIPVAPIEEQERIVNAVEQWFTLVDTLEKETDDLSARIRQTTSKILDLAIHGKLVPQDPSDEPAIELLKRINPKYTPCDKAHYENIPFEIPQNWLWLNHNSILDISGGSQPAKSYFKSKEEEGYIRLYQIRDYGETPVPVYIPRELASKTTQKGDILLARYGGSLGKVFIAEEGAYNVAMAKVIFKYNGLINKEYAYFYYLSSLYQDKLKSISRTAQAGFNSTDFEDMFFPLPPIAEQERIVTIINQYYRILDNISAEL